MARGEARHVRLSEQGAGCEKENWPNQRSAPTRDGMTRKELGKGVVGQ